MTATSANPLGKLALIDDAKRASALALVRRGRTYDLGHVLDEHVPVFRGRYFKQTDGVRRFALILTHPKLRGATGAWTSPIALV